MKPEINLPQGQVTLTTAEMWGVPWMPPCSSLLKAGHGAHGVRSVLTTLLLLHLLLLWSESESESVWKPERQGDDFLVFLWHFNKSRCLRKKDIDLDPAHSPGL